MTSVEAIARLSRDQFARLVKSLDRTVLLDFFRRLDPAVYARYFKGFRIQTLGRKRVTEALAYEVYERKNETAGDIVTLLWNQHHHDLYQAMLAMVKTISEDVESIERIEDQDAVRFIEELLQRFEREDILICVRLNDVRFSEEVIARLLEQRPVAEGVSAPAGAGPEAREGDPMESTGSGREGPVQTE